jgi:dehydrogenase/reductase SDR family protein 7B
MSFENKRIWITGASSGIGEQLAYAFAARKAHLILSSRNVPELEKVKANCQGAASVMIYPIDLADHEGVAGVAKRVLERYGKIDMLLHNGGLSQRALVWETKLSVDKYLMDVNYFGAVALTKAVLPSMITHQLGHIVVISSVMGYIGTQYRSAYAASKHALHGYFDSLRNEVYEDNIRITILCPGFVRTNVTLNALSGEGEKLGKMMKNTEKGMSPARFAQKALRAIEKEKEEVLIGGKEILTVYIKRFFPGFLSGFIRKRKEV